MIYVFYHQSATKLVTASPSPMCWPSLYCDVLQCYLQIMTQRTKT